MKKKHNKKNNQKDYTKTMSIARNCQNGVRLARPTNPLFFEGQSVEVSGGCFFGVGRLSEFLDCFFFLFVFWFFSVYFLFFFRFFSRKKTKNKQKINKTKKQKKKGSPKKKGVTPGPRSPGPPATQPPLTLHWRNLVPVETILCDIQVYAVFCCALFCPFVLPCFFRLFLFSSCFFHLFLFSSCFFHLFLFSSCFFDLFHFCFFSVLFIFFEIPVS